MNKGLFFFNQLRQVIKEYVQCHKKSAMVLNKKCKINTKAEENSFGKGEDIDQIICYKEYLI